MRLIPEFDIFDKEKKVMEKFIPVVVIKEIGETDKILTALNFLSMITINVGVFNLLPLPALDGGRLFFLFIEMIRRKPIPAEKEGKVHTVGLIILLAFMAIVTISDIIKQF